MYDEILKVQPEDLRRLASDLRFIAQRIRRTGEIATLALYKERPNLTCMFGCGSKLPGSYETKTPFTPGEYVVDTYVLDDIINTVELLTL